jgi:hypothetical protein
MDPNSKPRAISSGLTASLDRWKARPTASPELVEGRRAFFYEI